MFGALSEKKKKCDKGFNSNKLKVNILSRTKQKPRAKGKWLFVLRGIIVLALFLSLELYH